MAHTSRNAHAEQWHVHEAYRLSKKRPAPTESSGPLAKIQGVQQAATLVQQSTPAFDRLSRDIQALFNHHKQSPAVLKTKIELLGVLLRAIQPRFPSSSLYLVGSSVNGFGQNSSDVDLCLMMKESEVSWPAAVKVLETCQAILRKLSFVTEIKVIRATVPILDFKDKISGKECDMNVNNDVGIRNSHLLCLYSKYDNRVAPLVVFVKRWASFHNINSAKDNTLSSYVLTLMVIHFLQCGVKAAAILPALQQKHKELFNLPVHKLCTDVQLPVANAEANRQSLGELLLEFFCYYTTAFRFSVDVASIRLGRTLHIKDVKDKLTEPISHKRSQTPANSWQDALMYLEEPFSLTNAARNVYDQYTFFRIKRVFQKSYDILKHTLDANSIISNPF